MTRTPHNSVIRFSDRGMLSSRVFSGEAPSVATVSPLRPSLPSCRCPARTSVIHALRIRSPMQALRAAERGGWQRRQPPPPLLLALSTRSTCSGSRREPGTQSVVFRCSLFRRPSCSVSKYPIVIPHFEWTLEFALPTPVPMHQFEQSPVVIEVADRNPNADDLIFSVRPGRKPDLTVSDGTPFSGCAQGPNIVGGYTHPTTGKIVTREEHKAAQGAAEAEWHATHAGAE